MAIGRIHSSPGAATPGAVEQTPIAQPTAPIPAPVAQTLDPAKERALGQTPLPASVAQAFTGADPSALQAFEAAATQLGDRGAAAIVASSPITESAALAGAASPAVQALAAQVLNDSAAERALAMAGLAPETAALADQLQPVLDCIVERSSQLAGAGRRSGASRHAERPQRVVRRRCAAAGDGRRAWPFVSSKRRRRARGWLEQLERAKSGKSAEPSAPQKGLAEALRTLRTDFDTAQKALATERALLDKREAKLKAALCERVIDALLTADPAKVEALLRQEKTLLDAIGFSAAQLAARKARRK